MTDPAIYLSIGVLSAFLGAVIASAIWRAKHGSKFDGAVHKVMGAVQDAAWSDDSVEVVTRQANCIIGYRAALIDIRNQGIKSASGTARSMAQKAKEALRA